MSKLIDIMLLQQPKQYALIIENQSDMTSFGPLVGAGFHKIGAYLDELGEITSDVPFGEYPAYEQMTEDNVTFNTGFYTAKHLPGKNEIKSIIIPERKVIACLHKGTYEELAGLYNEMAEWIKTKGYEPSGTSIEHYYTGPEVPETEHITRVIMPLK